MIGFQTGTGAGILYRMATARLYAGTSGYSYKEWKGSFYPDDLKDKQFLEYYASRMPTVEINNTFYRFPGSTMLAGWREQTPDGFTFAVKANGRITHKSRLKDVEQITQDFVERCCLLGAKLGPILYQLPPFQRRDDERLAAFLKALPPGNRYTIEFRHKSWFEDEVIDMLREAGVALCLSEDDKFETPRTVTASFCYIRLRKDAYDEAQLKDWHDWIAAQTAEGRDVFTYLKHDESGVSPEPILQAIGWNPPE